MLDLPIDLKNPCESELVRLTGPGRVVVLGAYELLAADGVSSLPV